MKRTSPRRHCGLSLIELLLVVVIIGILATLAIVRFSQSAGITRENACFHNRSEINSAAERYALENGSFPATINDLNNNTYFPSGIPTCPVSGSAYTLNATTGRVIGHTTRGGGTGDH